MGSEHAVAFVALANPQYFSELFTIHINHNALNEKVSVSIFRGSKEVGTLDTKGGKLLRGGEPTRMEK